MTYPPGSPPAAAADAIRQVALACRIIARFGHEELTLGHASVRGPDGVPVFDGTTGLVTTPEEGKGVVRALGAGRAVLLRNHGILVAGQDISWAVLTAITLERAARIQFIARTLGDPVPIPREMARE